MPSQGQRQIHHANQREVSKCQRGRRLLDCRAELQEGCEDFLGLSLDVVVEEAVRFWAGEVLLGAPLSLWVWVLG